MNNKKPEHIILDKDLIIIDIETTGVDNPVYGMKYSACELAAVKMSRNLDVYEEFYTYDYIRPIEDPHDKKSYMKAAMETHKISKEKLINAPEFKDVIVKFEDWVGEDKEKYQLCSWGDSFDFPYLQVQYYKIGRKWPFQYRYFDLRSVFQWEKMKLGCNDDYSLRDYCREYGITVSEKDYHTARGDVYLLVKLLHSITREQ